MKLSKSQIMVFFLDALLMLFLAACGTENIVASVTEENATAATEESSKEVDPDATYVEANGLEYEERSAVSTNGVLYVGNNTDTLQAIDVNFEITNVVIEDVEATKDDKKTITIKQLIEGYIWTDGNIFATNLNVPVARLANAYDGQMIAVGDEDVVETELKWKDNTYTISAVETTSWEDDDWNDGWYSDPDGDGERLNSRLIVKTVVTVNEDYDGLVLVLTPIVDANGSVDGDFIMDVWTEDSKLFNVNDMSANFVADTDAEEVEGTETDEAEEESAEEEVKAESKTEETKPAATTAPKEEHKHSYTSTDSPSSCTVAGIRTYTCTTCGYSYTENLGYGDHNYIASTQEIFHDEVWSTVPRTVTTRTLRCGCGAKFSTQADLDAHQIANIEANGPFIACAGPDAVEEKSETVYDYVKTSDAWTETITTYTCSVCGKTKN